jgi:hypothetical protein
VDRAEVMSYVEEDLGGTVAPGVEGRIVRE